MSDTHAVTSAVLALQREIESVVGSFETATDPDLSALETRVHEICAPIAEGRDLTAEHKRQLLVEIEASVTALDRLATEIRDRQRTPGASADLDRQDSEAG